MRVAEYIASRLALEGVRSVFAVAGASHTHLLDALDRRGVRIVSNRHESGAVSAADGYARASGRPGVALIIADQGLPNAIGGLAAAFEANSPVLVFVASTPPSWRAPGSNADAAQRAMVSALSKGAWFSGAAHEVPAQLDAALATARGARPGPVLLFIPADQLGAACDEAGPRRETEVASRSATERTSRRAPDPALIDTAADLLARAQRPLILAGAGATWGDAREGLERLVEHSATPLTANGLGRGLLAEDDERCFSWPYAQIAAREADCVLVVGSRLLQRQGFGVPPRFDARAKFIRIDIDPREGTRPRPFDVFIEADAGVACSALAEALVRRPSPPPERRGWLRRALEPRRERVAALAEAPRAGLHPLRLARLLQDRLPADALYVGDGADIQSWMYGAIRIRRPRGFLDHYPIGAMGMGTALAVGGAAALADGALEDQARVPPTVLVTGDGSLGFFAAELHAAARAGLRLIVIVGNDGAWGTEVHEQLHAIGRTINTELGALPYERVAEGFGCTGLRARDEAELAAALDVAFAADGPVLVNALIDADAGAQLKSDPLLKMILFSDLAEGLRALG
jgi:acetolactate synthase-1/2/3 large subunit